MSPFIGTPLGLSPDTLKLLDQVFTEIWQELTATNRLLGSNANKTAPRTTSPSRLVDVPAVRRARPSTSPRRSPELAAFDYTAPAELLATTGQATAKRYRRFATGADTLRNRIASCPAAAVVYPGNGQRVVRWRADPPAV
jgi:hypothetical protein